MNKAKWIIFAAVVIAIFGGLIYFNKSTTKDYSNIDATKIITDGPIADHVEGPTDQKVTLIEYGDFQCSACIYTYKTVSALTAKYGDKLTFIFRNFPLTSSHPNALAAATAAESAGLQGKYFEMYNILYQNQSVWSSASTSERTEIFKSYAEEIGLDVDKYTSSLTSSDISDKIARDKATGLDQFDVSGTPTFILNGEVIDSSIGVDSDAFTKLVEDAITTAYGS